MAQQSIEYTTAGVHTFNVPANISCVFASGIAAGGGAGVTTKSGVANGQSPGAGGAGESCDNVFVKVTALGTLSVTVGAGGVGGSITVSATNVHAGPPGSTAFGAGFGGGDTIIGPLRLVGGYGGLTSDIAPHAGMGGGWRAFKGPGTGYAIGQADNGQYSGGGQHGFWPNSPNSPRHFSGPGGGTGGGGDGSSREAGSIGGSLGPYLGGTVAANGSADSGGTGGASVYGPGGDGGDGSDTSAANAPAVPVNSYGCGGGAPGGTHTGGATANKWFGAAGHDGYVLLTWFEP